jgi:ABC-type sugar transport system substrate-binding protein
MSCQIEAVKNAKAKGVKIIYVDSAANEPAIATLSTNNFQAGALAGDTMVAGLEAAYRFIVGNDDLVGLYGTNEGSTVGVGNAVKALGKNIIGIGFDSLLMCCISLRCT